MARGSRCQRLYPRGRLLDGRPTPARRLLPLGRRFQGIAERDPPLLSNAEIADTLVISMATVKTHVRHIFAKLDVRDRAQAIVLAHDAGLRPPEGTG